MTRRARTTAPTARRRKRMPRAAMIGALITGLVAGGGGAAWALWSADATASGQANAAQLQLVTTDFSAINQNWANHSATSSYTHTGSVSFRNTTDTTSATPQNLTIAFTTPSSNAQLAATLNVKIWSVSTSTTCSNSTTQPSGAIGTTWANLSALTITTTLTAGETKKWCVRTSSAERSSLATTVGTASVTPHVTGTLTIGTWSTTAQAAAAYGTQYIYPAYTPDAAGWFFVRPYGGGDCLDVEENLSTSGTAAISYGCKSSGTENQEWRFTPTDTGYVAVTPRHAQGLRLSASSANTGELVNLVTAVTVGTSTASQRQQWQLQSQGGGYYQLVNRSTGYCALPQNIDGDAIIEITQQICNGSTAQRWTLEARSIQYAVTCQDYGSGSGRNVRLSLNVAHPSALGVYMETASGWDTMGTWSANTTTYSNTWVPSGNYATGTTRTVEIRSGSTVIATSAVTVQRQNPSSGYYYLRCA